MVTGDFVRVTNRPGQQKLGANGRDDGPVVRFGYFLVRMLHCFLGVVRNGSHTVPILDFNPLQWSREMSITDN